MISCDNYDYVEIACTYNYPLKLTLKSGEIIEGVAKDTALNENRQEAIKLEIDNHDLLVVLDDILTLEVTIENPHFKSVRLTA